MLSLPNMKGNNWLFYGDCWRHYPMTDRATAGFFMETVGDIIPWQTGQQLGFSWRLLETLSHDRQGNSWVFHGDCWRYYPMTDRETAGFFMETVGDIIPWQGNSWVFHGDCWRYYPMTDRATAGFFMETVGDIIPWQTGQQLGFSWRLLEILSHDRQGNSWVFHGDCWRHYPMTGQQLGFSWWLLEILSHDRQVWQGLAHKQCSSRSTLVCSTPEFNYILAFYAQLISTLTRWNILRMWEMRWYLHCKTVPTYKWWRNKQTRTERNRSIWYRIETNIKP